MIPYRYLNADAHSVDITIGVSIKILLVSNIEGGIDSLISSVDFQGVTVVSKEIDGDYAEVSRRACGIFSQGSFDLIIAVTDNAVGANVAFNKTDGMVSSVCKNVDDANEARDNGANVIVIKEDNADQLEGIIGAFSKGGGFKLKLKPQPKATIRPAPQPQVQQTQQKGGTVLFKPKAKAPEPEEQQGPKRPGMMGWLKDELGIMDVEKPKPKKDDKKTDSK